MKTRTRERAKATPTQAAKPGAAASSTSPDSAGSGGGSAAAAAAAVPDAGVLLDVTAQLMQEQAQVKAGQGQDQAEQGQGKGHDPQAKRQRVAKPPLPPRSPRETRAKRDSGGSAPNEEPGKQGGGEADEGAGDGGSRGTGHGAAASEVAGAHASVGAARASDLDLQRAELMERNRRMLLSLNLPGLVAETAAAAGKASASSGDGSGGAAKSKPSQRGVAKRARDGSTEPAPRRVSLRQRGVSADPALAAGVDSETPGGGLVLAAGQRALAAATGRAGAEEPEEPKGRHPRGRLPFRSENGSPDSDAAFLRLLAASAEAAAQAPAGAKADAAAGTGAGAGGEAVAKFGLVEKDVAKVTKDGVTHLVWLPGGGNGDRLLLAAADKGGRVSMWDVDSDESGPAAETDGVLMFAPHGEYVSGMRWLGRQAAVGANRLITASYDGSLRALDLGDGGRWLQLPAPGKPEDAEWSALELSADGRTAYLGDPMGFFELVDLRDKPRPVAASGGAEAPGATAPEAGGAAAGEGGKAQPKPRAEVEELMGPAGNLMICDRKINSLHLEPSGTPLLATSCSNGSVGVWDIRMLERGIAGVVAAAKAGGSGGAIGAKTKPLSLLRHAKSCHAAYWAPDGSKRLLSTSYDDTLRVWADPATGGAADGSRLSQLLSISHNNQTGRWITPFRAVWSAAADAVLVGSMKRGLDVFTAPSPAAAQQGAGGVPSPARGKKAPVAEGVADPGGKLLATLSSEYMTAIPSRAAPHPLLPVVVAATSSGRCHIWR
ncbi:hypothetical protein HXX76_006552 [Chlamydomonas incerta]|uniref:Uncharacterized protein n=1 Tax=Chlamydomonas incerta TaxID=51695 RepID=A0A835W588_CHLIN|nr:hypothetical protein HXX76_006552 [Chlamydomonas incerta]|eukprot:KAG2436241.1 hypothetical protein HXX76_006552 [Chlamydomonas incerta]